MLIAYSVLVLTSTVMAPPRSTVPLNKLLSTCVDAARLGCIEIQRVQAKRVAQQDIGVKKKDETDDRSFLTEADLAAQEVMVAALRRSWDGINIIGEEDESATSAANPSEEPAVLLRTDLCGDADEDSGAICVSLSDVVVFVDPLDGTREFVEGRLHAVQSLVGISVNGRSVAGAVGLPFPTAAPASPATDAEEEIEPVVVYAQAEGGVSGTYGARTIPPPAASDTSHPIITTGDSSNSLLGKARSAALKDGGSTVLAGGAGNKLLSVVEGRADMAIMHFGTSLWDTAAPEALVRAAGGRVTDLFGAPLVHSASPPSGDLLNGLGVVASSAEYSALHDALCATMRREPSALKLLQKYIGGTEGGGEGDGDGSGFAADVARSLDGGVLDVSWLNDKLTKGSSSSSSSSSGSSGGGGGPVLKGFGAPEGGAFRGMMSDGCRLVLEWEDDEEEKPSSLLPATAFYKRVVMGDLASTRLKALSAPKKLLRDVRSYRVEAAFLGSQACQMLYETGLKVPKAYHVDLRPSEEAPIDSKFAMVLSDFDHSVGWRQEGLLTSTMARATLSALAKFHAFFWSGSKLWTETPDAAKELEEAVWKAGGYWQPSMQTAEQFDKLSDKYLEHTSKFGAAFTEAAELQGLGGEEVLSAIGKRLQGISREVAAAAHPFDSEAVAIEGNKTPSSPSSSPPPPSADRFRTLIHGDPKAANLFLRGEEEDAAAALEVGLIDFQWTGFGLAATDVAHHLCASVEAAEGSLDIDGKCEAELLDLYHTRLCTHLAEFGVATSEADAASNILSREELQAQYETALLDMGRLVFAYQWSRANFDGKPNLNRNAYNKNGRNAAWLVARCDRLMKARGV